jgi:two-component system, NarL family, sensor histidine kinase DesK
MRLLPRDQEVAWTPYVWLVYLINLVIYPWFRHAGAEQWLWTGAGIAVFLPMYFAGYWLAGRRELWVIAGITALGIVYAPFNPGASIYFVYAACFVGKVGEPREAAPWLAGIVAIILAESLLLRLGPAFWGPALFFSIVMGAVTIHTMQRHRVNRRLRMAQQEVEHLAKVAERERIARDLHDVLGHTLSLVILKSELASKLADKDAARAAAEIRDVERISREALAQVREAVRGYRSAGLATELCHAQEALEAAGIQVAASAEAPALSPAQESVLVLALREAVTNVVRHAQATACRLQVRRAESCCELVVADNGRGGASPDGFGLSGMRERVQSLGGSLERDGSHGTTLRIRLPLKDAGAQTV